MTEEEMNVLIDALIALNDANKALAAEIKSIREWIDANK